ncbi:Hypothetical predicted protein [Lecanosticta acicola]|uniref:Uncharacterized protein n=1 Tax=Lecanosticta acicola TaxID=111012 RepID=A0AAI9EBA2_9PEZI|nr:Hypothetical predicted protein [Lecanosticta acicola]
MLCNLLFLVGVVAGLLIPGTPLNYTENAMVARMEPPAGMSYDQSDLHGPQVVIDLSARGKRLLENMLGGAYGVAQSDVDTRFPNIRLWGWRLVVKGPQFMAGFCMLENVIGVEGFLDDEDATSNPQKPAHAAASHAEYTGFYSFQNKAIVWTSLTSPAWPQGLTGRPALGAGGNPVPEVRDIKDLDFQNILAVAKRSDRKWSPSSPRITAPRWWEIRLGEDNPVPEQTRKVVTSCLARYKITDLPHKDNIDWPKGALTFPIGSLCYLALLATEPIKQVAIELASHQYQWDRAVIGSITAVDSGLKTNAEIEDPLPWFVIYAQKESKRLLKARDANREFENRLGQPFQPHDQWLPFARKSAPQWPYPMRPTKRMETEGISKGSDEASQPASGQPGPSKPGPSSGQDKQTGRERPIQPAAGPSKPPSQGDPSPNQAAPGQPGTAYGQYGSIGSSGGGQAAGPSRPGGSKQSTARPMSNAEREYARLLTSGVQPNDAIENIASRLVAARRVRTLEEARILVRTEVGYNYPAAPANPQESMQRWYRELLQHAQLHPTDALAILVRAWPRPSRNAPSDDEIEAQIKQILGLRRRSG